MKKKMAVALIAAMTVAAGAGSVVVQAAPQEAKSVTENADVLAVTFAEDDLYYMGTGENDTTVILGASEDWSDYEAVITENGTMTIITSRDMENKTEKEVLDTTASVEVSEDKDSVTITLPDGSKVKAERSDLMKSLMQLIGAVDTFESAVDRGELDAE